MKCRIWQCSLAMFRTDEACFKFEKAVQRSVAVSGNQCKVSGGQWRSVYSDTLPHWPHWPSHCLFSLPLANGIFNCIYFVEEQKSYWNFFHIHKHISVQLLSSASFSWVAFVTETNQVWMSDGFWCIILAFFFTPNEMRPVFATHIWIWLRPMLVD